MWPPINPSLSYNCSWAGPLRLDKYAWPPHYLTHLHYPKFHKTCTPWVWSRCLLCPSGNQTLLIRSSIWESKTLKWRYWYWQIEMRCFSLRQIIWDKLKRTKYLLLNSQTMSNLIYWDAHLALTSLYWLSSLTSYLCGGCRRLPNSPVQPVRMYSWSEQGHNLLNNNG